MRCPKCGFISFDDQSECGKCSQSLAETVEQLHGTSIKVNLPSYLNSLFEKAAVEEKVEAEAIGGVEDAEAEPAINLEGLDVSDLVPSQDDDEPVLDLEDEGGIEFDAGDEGTRVNNEGDEVVDLAEPDEEVLSFEDEPAEEAYAEVEFAGDEQGVEEIVDLSVVMGGDDEEPDEVEAAEIADLPEGGELPDVEAAVNLPPTEEDEPSLMDLSLEDLTLEAVDEEEEGESYEESVADSGLSLEDSVEDDEDISAVAEEEELKESEQPDSGLTIEKDDE